MKVSPSRTGRPGFLAAGVDALLDALVIPGYSRLGPVVRRRWWPADPQPFRRPTSVLVTGASSGLGRETAIALADLGAQVHLVGRSRDRLADVAATIIARRPAEDPVVRQCDVSDLTEVRRLVAAVRADVPALRALIHGAGVVPAERSVTPQGHEVAFATHVLGPYALTAGLLQPLRNDGDGRVVLVSSGGMYTAAGTTDLEFEEGNYSGIRAYARTKRLQVLLAERLASALSERADPVVHSMHPGWAATPGLADSLPGFGSLTRPILRTAAQGADTIVWLAASPEAGRSSGRFWHDRKARPTHYLRWQRDNPAVGRALWQACIDAAGPLGNAPPTAGPD